MEKVTMTIEQAREMLTAMYGSWNVGDIERLKQAGYIIQNPVEEIDYLIPKHYGEYTPEDITKIWNAIQYLKEELEFTRRPPKAIKRGE